jgi:hypothetical protein
MLLTDIEEAVERVDGKEHGRGLDLAQLVKHSSQHIARNGRLEQQIRIERALTAKGASDVLVQSVLQRKSATSVVTPTLLPR